MPGADGGDRVNRRWLMAARPDGNVRPSDFALDESPVPPLVDGQILVATDYLSVSPVMRHYMLRAAAGEPALEVGQVMRGRGVGTVLDSRHPGFAAGDVVHGPLGWQTHAVLAPTPKTLLFTVRQRVAPISTAIGVLGMTGYSAWFGFHDIGRPKVGDTVVVSGAAGGVGSVVGPLAKIAGCRVIGIAGGAEKCRLLTGRLRYDDAIDYRNEDVDARLAALCPSGIDIYFDNVGGRILDTCLGHIARKGRVVMCGRISEYLDGPLPGLANYHLVGTRNARMEGFFVYDYADRFAEAEARMAAWVASGELPYVEDRLDGFERMPEALAGLYEGTNLGKRIVAVSERALAGA